MLQALEVCEEPESESNPDLPITRRMLGVDLDGSRWQSCCSVCGVGLVTRVASGLRVQRCLELLGQDALCSLDFDSEQGSRYPGHGRAMSCPADS